MIHSKPEALCPKIVFHSCLPQQVVAGREEGDGRAAGQGGHSVKQTERRVPTPESGKGAEKSEDNRETIARKSDGQKSL